MTKSEEKSSSREVLVKGSFETEKTLVDASILSSRSSSIFSSWQRWVPGFRRYNNVPKCKERTKTISPNSGLPNESGPEAVCNCPKCVSEAEARSRAIDLELQQDAELAKNDKKILLLGYTESIDQFSKQLLRVDKDQYATEELDEKKISIRKQASADMADQLSSWSQMQRGSSYRKPEPVGGVDEKDLESLLAQVEACEILTPEQAIAFDSIWLGHWEHYKRKPHPSMQ